MLIGLANLVSSADVGMVERRIRLCFPHEPGPFFFTGELPIQTPPLQELVDDAAEVLHGAKVHEGSSGWEVRFIYDEHGGHAGERLTLTRHDYVPILTNVITNGALSGHGEITT